MKRLGSEIFTRQLLGRERATQKTKISSNTWATQVT